MSAITDVVHELIEVVAGRQAILSDQRADELHTQLDQPEPEPEPAPVAERPAEPAAPAGEQGFAPEPADPPADPLAPQGSL